MRRAIRKAPRTHRDSVGEGLAGVATHARPVVATHRLCVATLAILGTLSACAGGRVYTGRHVHVGVRPAAANEGGAITVQVSTDALP